MVWEFRRNFLWEFLDYGNLLEIYFPKPGTGQILNPTDAFTKRKAVASGMYSVNEELDSEYIFSDIEYAGSLLALKKNEVTSIEIKLSSNANEDFVRSEIKSIFNNSVTVKNRIQQNDGLYKMIKCRKFICLHICKFNRCNCNI